MAAGTGPLMALNTLSETWTTNFSVPVGLKNVAPPTAAMRQVVHEQPQQQPVVAAQVAVTRMTAPVDLCNIAFTSAPTWETTSLTASFDLSINGPPAALLKAPIEVVAAFVTTVDALPNKALAEPAAKEALAKKFKATSNTILG